MQIDPRGPRFAAVLTSLVLAAVLLTGSGTLLAVQTLVFAAGAFGGLRHAPYGWLYRVLLQPRLGPPAELEDARPPRFAQAVGFGFALVGTLGYLGGATWLGLAATGLALAAAFLNAAFDYCLGCEFYLLLRRARPGLGA
ncbi:DUF4395 domain-containing protein [Kitasatospora sp. NPDC049285]|uniref:DUF4395 domain-containing protein n=1 Tax=Kitasatospora sp. NPDC049285 TaxID=3157096 RepID=UPI0034431A6F